jgi:hypothetical protein
VGSSRTSTPGAHTSSAVRASRCLPPWLSSHGLTFSSPAKPKNSIAPATSSTGRSGRDLNRNPELELGQHSLGEQHLVGRLSSSATCAACSKTRPGLTCLPRNLTVPLAGVPRPTASPVRVDLPDPFAPISATHSSSQISRLTSSTAFFPPNSTLTCCQESTGWPLLSRDVDWGSAGAVLLTSPPLAGAG